MLRTRSVTMNPIGAKATPKAAKPIPSIALIMLIALVTPALIEASAPAAASAAPPPVGEAVAAPAVAIAKMQF